MYAVISVGGKQYRVREGERLLVDRVRYDERKTFHPQVLLTGDDGDVQLAPDGVQVTARVVAHPLGAKVRIGKYRAKTGYRRHTGHRSRLSQIEIESIGAPTRRTKSEEPKAARGEAAEREEPREQDQQQERTERAPKPPKGYEGLTVAQIGEAARSWRRPQLEAALAYEREHAGRKGAIAALESALAPKEEK